MHFISEKGWIGDPNGLIYFNHEYHLFYQFEPKMNVFSPNMHWGHAVSSDLFNWTTLKIALHPDKLGAIWSGSAVIDENNTTGFGKNTLVCIYTSAGGETYKSSDEPFTISIAYSVDGINFIKYENNPIIKNIAIGNRDPKVFWCEKLHKWIMVMYMGNKMACHSILESPNLKDWNSLQTINIPEFDDCPDLFQINDDKYIFMSTNGKYVIGTFDGIKFTQETAVQRFAFGDTYSSQSWNNDPLNRKLLTFRLGNMGEPSEMSQMSIPIELKYENNVVQCRPIVEPFIFQHYHISNQFIDEINIPIPTPLLQISIFFNKSNSDSHVELINGTIKYNSLTNQISYKDTIIDIDTEREIIKLQIISDVYSIEIFVNDEKYIGYFQNGNSFYKIKLANIDVREMTIMLQKEIID